MSPTEPPRRCNLKSVRRMMNPLEPGVAFGTGDENDGTCCPVCGFDYVHAGQTFVVDGEDAYKAWAGRGDLTVIPFWAECGHTWELCFGFHKGTTTAFLRVPIDTEESLRVGPFDYEVYLASAEWHAKAEKEKERAGQRCQVCNKTRSETALNTHHRTYERIGREIDGDLVVLCRECHTLFHENGRLARPTT